MRYPTTIQNDLDQLFWVGPTLWLLDDGRFYTLNPATGAATFAVTPVPEVLKVTRDDVAGVTFGTTRDDPRRLVEVDLATGTLTTIGVTHTALEHGGELFESIFAAPPCP